MNLPSRFADWLLHDLIEARVQEAVKVVDDRYWRELGAAAPNDLAWTDRSDDLSSALEAWRHNPIARQVARLTRGFVLQDGITFVAKPARMQRFVDAFWNHRQNRMARRLRVWCDALTLNGELFPVLFTNPADGMTYVRSVSARLIDAVETNPDDLEHELRYHQITDSPEGRWWLADRPDDVEMLHFAVNRLEGAARGSGDLDPLLPWLRRYKDWLVDRVVINRQKSRYVWDVTVEGASTALLMQRKREIEQATQTTGGVNIHNESERLSPLYAGFAADTVEADGRALRMMLAAGAGVPLHMLGDPDTTARATAGDATRGMLSHYRTRQLELIEMVSEVIERAALRAQAAGRLVMPRGGLQLQAQVQELTREDNLLLAQAAEAIVKALEAARANGWVDDATAQALMLKFAGESATVSMTDPKGF